MDNTGDVRDSDFATSVHADARVACPLDEVGRSDETTPERLHAAIIFAPLMSGLRLAIRWVEAEADVGRTGMFSCPAPEDHA